MKRIEAYTLLFRKVTFDFEEKFDKDMEEGSGRVAKRTFSLTFNAMRDNKDNIEKKPCPRGREKGQ